MLKLSGAAVAAPLVAGSPLVNLVERKKALAFAFFSDTHVSARTNVDKCRAMLDEMKATFDPAFALCAGDITEYGWQSDYEAYVAMVKAWGTPVHNAPGNHDVRWSPLGMTAFNRNLGPEYSAVEQDGCHAYMLDSSVPLSHWGHYEKVQLEWLAAQLKKAGREAPVFLVTHHWVGREDMTLDNEEELFKVIEPYNVKLILNGHGHSDLLWEWNGIVCTMNAGLYQGSYERVEVDRERGEVRLDRRTTASKTLQPLATVPLAPNRRKLQVFSLGAFAPRKGEPVPIGGGATPDYSWRKGPWAKAPAEGVPTAGLVAGVNTLYLRNTEKDPAYVRDLRVRDDENRLQPVWETDLTGGVMSHLTLDGPSLLVSAMDGSVTCLNAKSGDVVWRAKTGKYCHSSPAVADGRVVLGSADNYVYAFDRKGGQRKWRVKTGGPVYASPACAKGVAGVASGDGAIYGIDLKTGAVRWRYEMPKSNTAFCQSMAATDGERFFFGAWDSHLYALDVLTGQLVWRAGCCAGRSFAYSPAIGSPCADGGRVYIVANGNRLYSFDCQTGAPIWEVTSPGDKYGHSSPVAVNGRVYVGGLGDKGQLRCVDAATGKELWCANTGEVIYDSSPAVADGCVSIGSVSGLLSVADAAGGRIVGQYRMPVGHFLSSPAAQNGWVYAGTYSNKVVGFRLAKEV